MRVRFNCSCWRARRIGSEDVQLYEDGSFFVGVTTIGLMACSNAVNGISRAIRYRVGLYSWQVEDLDDRVIYRV